MIALVVINRSTQDDMMNDDSIRFLRVFSIMYEHFLFGSVMLPNCNRGRNRGISVIAIAHERPSQDTSGVHCTI